MAHRIIIEVADKENLALACREVANLIDADYTNGMIGCGDDTFTTEEV